MSKPTFQLHVSPGLTLEDTKFELARGQKITRPKVRDTGYLVKLWIRDNRPKYVPKIVYGMLAPGSTDYGYVDSLGRDELVGTIQRDKARVTLTPVALQHAVFSNLNGEVPSHDSTSLSDSVSVGTQIGWSKSRSETIGESVTVGVEAGPISGGASLNHSVTTEVGVSASDSRTVDVGSTEDVSIEVPPGLVELAILFVQRGTVSTDLNLLWRLTGWVNVSLYDYPAYHAGKIPSPLVECIRLPAEALQRYTDYAEETAEVSVQFAGQDTINTVTVRANDPKTIGDAIVRATDAFAQKSVGLQRTAETGLPRAGDAVREPDVVTWSLLRYASQGALAIAHVDDAGVVVTAADEQSARLAASKLENMSPDFVLIDRSGPENGE